MGRCCSIFAIPRFPTIAFPFNSTNLRTPKIRLTEVGLTKVTCLVSHLWSFTDIGHEADDVHLPAVGPCSRKVTCVRFDECCVKTAYRSGFPISRTSVRPHMMMKAGTREVENSL